MADVRLTATNPEDSSVVPVACNSKGELLIDKPVINEIDNNVTITGSLKTAQPDSYWRKTGSFFGLQGADGGMLGQFCHHGGDSSALALVAGGCRTINDQWLSYGADGVGNALGIFMGAKGSQIKFAIDENKETGTTRDLTSRFEVSVTGGQFEVLRLGPLNGQKGATIDVGEELEFLRAQVRALMEKLRMTPEGGWEVWDGSTET